MLFKAASKAIFALLVLAFVPAGASATELRCMDSGVSLPVANGPVLEWKASTPNRYKRRARIQGVIQKTYLIRESHVQFQLRIGRRQQDTIEVIYNRKFGELPSLSPGMRVEACGDYITANQPYQRLQPSPDGAIIHWVHMNPEPNSRRHDHGYLVIEGRLFGFEVPEGEGDRAPRR